MQSPEELLHNFCETYGITDTTDRDRAFFMGALAMARKTAVPAAWAPLDAAGLPMAVLDALPKEKRPRMVPLYRDPLTVAPKPPLTEREIEHIRQTYYADDAAGLHAFMYRYYTGT